MHIYKKIKNKRIFLQADLQIKMYKPENAVSLLEKGLDISEPDTNLLRLLVVAYWNSRKLDESIKTLHRLEKIHEDKIGYKWEMGVYLLRLGFFDRALYYFEYCLKEMPDNENIHSGLAFCYLYLEQYDNAEKIIKYSTKMTPWNPDICSAVPLLYLATSRFDLIEEHLKDYVDRYPYLYPGHVWMGNHVQYRLYRPSESLPWYAKGEELFSDSKMNKYLSSYEFVGSLKDHLLDAYTEALVKTGQKEFALEKISYYIKKNRRNHAAKTRLIEYYLNIGNYSAAEQEARRAYELNLNWPEYLPLLSTALLKQNRVAEALKSAKDSVEQAKENIDAWKVLGNVEKQLGNWQNAINAYDETIKHNPFDPDILGELSTCYQGLNQNNDALTLSTKRTILDPKNPDVWFDLEALYKKMGKSSEAEKANKKGAELRM